MGTYFAIQSKLSGNVIDIEGASTKPGALLDAFSQKTTGSDNQMWELIPDPAGSGYYFIKSKLSGNVIDIEGAHPRNLGVLLDAFSQKTTGSDNQLWEFIPDPAGSGYYFIRSKLSGNVIDIVQAPRSLGLVSRRSRRRRAISTTSCGEWWTERSLVLSTPVYLGSPKARGLRQTPVLFTAAGISAPIRSALPLIKTVLAPFQVITRTVVMFGGGRLRQQGFVAAFFVYDTSGKCYVLSYSGVIPSAPQKRLPRHVERDPKMPGDSGKLVSDRRSKEPGPRVRVEYL